MKDQQKSKEQLVEELRELRTRVAEDVTERRLAQDALRKSEERFRAIFESSADCILVWDRDYNYLHANQAAIDHVATTREKVIGKNMRDGLGHVPDFMRLWMSRVEVEDWGIGFATQNVTESCFGLEGIRERARLFGGSATIDSNSGKGTRISVELPLVKA